MLDRLTARLVGVGLAGALSALLACGSSDPAPEAASDPTPVAAREEAPPQTAPEPVRAEPGGPLTGSVEDYHDRPLAGALVTAFDDARGMNVSVYTNGDGRFRFPQLSTGSYRLRARIIGHEIQQRAIDLSGAGLDARFSLRLAEDPEALLPASYFYSRLEWPSQKVRTNFALACANCHQIGDALWRKPRDRSEWEAVVERMRFRGPRLEEETADLLLPALIHAFGPGHPEFELPDPPTGDATRVVLWEYEVDPQGRNGCHDLELGLDGTIYTEHGFTVDPVTFERRHYGVDRRAHSIERAPDGNMWITVVGVDRLEKLDVKTGEVTSYDHPQIGDDKGRYPHTLRFDERGRIWYTLTISNHVAVFDPTDETFRYYDLPPPMEWGGGTASIPVAYGLDVAPDQSVWWSQLIGHTIGRVDPETGKVDYWRSPVEGPRRLRVGPDNTVWVPGYGTSDLGRFDPKTETWKVYPLPTEPRGTELPYALSVNRRTNEVWVAGSNSDSLIRFRPETEEFTVFPLATPVDFTREIEFDDEGNVWTCAPDRGLGPEGPLSGRFIKLELLERVGRCGDGEVQLGEQCDDGNDRDADGCSSGCIWERPTRVAWED